VLDYCLNEWFNATCERFPDHVVLMTSARFGRMSSGRCISGDFNVGCVKDVLRQMDGVCSGLTSCDVSVRSLVDLHPCQKDFVSYLEASYDCVQGILLLTPHLSAGFGVDNYLSHCYSVIAILL